MISFHDYQLYNIWVQLSDSSIGDREDIFVTRLIIIIKSEVATSPTIVISLRDSVSEMVPSKYIMQ